MTEQEQDVLPGADTSTELYALAREQGYRAALHDVAEWLERTGGCKWGHPSLYQRAEIAANLRDGTWRDLPKLKGLREGELLRARAGQLTRRGVAQEDMPEEVRAWLESDRAKRAGKRRAFREEVAGILAADHGIDLSDLDGQRVEAIHRMTRE